ncbi:major facilitator superfamily domain-containing protein [Dichotomocladium elegans]|nr:major facilitator superfamily domain-containing protein [Dichotomocladium elegans]
MLSYTALQPLYGRISDAFGRKSALLFAVTVFFIGSLLCGAATDMWSLVIARGIAGIGGGGLNTMSAVITSDLVSLRERGKYQGYANISYALGSVIGAPLGGLITDAVGWRYCFYINLPILCISLYVASFLLTNYNLKEQIGTSTTWERFKKIDYLGAVLVVIGVVVFMLATSLGGNSRPWSDSLVVGCLGISLLSAVAFCVVEIKVAVNPLMPWHIVTSRTPFTCSLANFFGVLCSYGMTYTTPLFFQGLLGYSPAQAGLFFLPKIAALSVGSLAAGYWISYTGEYRRFLIFSSGLSLLSMILYSLWTPETSFCIVIPSLMIDGFSSGAIVTAALVAMLSCVDQQEMATITSMSYLFRSTGAVIGISATSAIFQGVVKSVLTERITGPDAEKIIEIARKSMTEVRELLPPDALQIVLESYQEGISDAFIFCAGIAALCLVATLFVKNHDLGTSIPKKKIFSYTRAFSIGNCHYDSWENAT